MQKARTVVYIDAFGREHEALVFAAKRRSSYRDRNQDLQVLFTPLTHTETGTADCMVSGVYINPELPEADSVIHFYDVPHFTDPSKEETNPALPSYQLNCWKEFYEEHDALPKDHAAFDHPFHVEHETDADGNFVLDGNGNKIRKQVPRPEYDAHVASHQARPEVQEAMAAAAAEPAEKTADQKDAIAFLVTRGYAEADAEHVVSVMPGDLVKGMAEAGRAQREASAALAQGDGDPGDSSAPSVDQKAADNDEADRSK